MFAFRRGECVFDNFNCFFLLPVPSNFKRMRVKSKVLLSTFSLFDKSLAAWSLSVHYALSSTRVIA